MIILTHDMLKETISNIEFDFSKQLNNAPFHKLAINLFLRNAMVTILKFSEQIDRFLFQTAILIDWFVCFFDLILYVPSTIFQLNRDGSFWVEPILSYDNCVLLKNHNAVTPVRLEPAASRSRVKHSTTEPLRSHKLGWGHTLLAEMQGGRHRDHIEIN